MQFKLRSRFLVIVLSLAAALLPATGVAQKPKSWPGAKRADELVEAYRRKYNLPAVSVAIAHRGKIVYVKATGWQDREAKVPATAQTRFRLASVSKPITAVMAMELVEQRKLKLDAKVLSVVKLPPHHVYTIRDLLCHQSSVRHYKNDPRDPTRVSRRAFPSAKDALPLFVADPLIMKPGEKFSYSTHAYTVLAAAIESTTRSKFPAYATKRFQAWGLKELDVERPEVLDRHRTQIYRLVNGQNQVSPRDHLSWKTAGGGLQSSASELCRLGLLLCNNRILKEKTREAMWTPQKTSNGKPTAYALGWRVQSDKQRRRMAEHSGSQNGAKSYWRLYPQEQTVIAVLTNRGENNPKTLTEDLARVIFENK